MFLCRELLGLFCFFAFGVVLLVWLPWLVGWFGFVWFLVFFCPQVVCGSFECLPQLVIDLPCAVFTYASWTGSRGPGTRRTSGPESLLSFLSLQDVSVFVRLLLLKGGLTVSCEGFLALFAHLAPYEFVQTRATRAQTAAK